MHKEWTDLHFIIECVRIESVKDIIKMLFVFAAFVLYCAGWADVLSVIEKENDSIMSRIFSAVWIIFHIIFLARFMSWFWNL